MEDTYFKKREYANGRYQKRKYTNWYTQIDLAHTQINNQDMQIEYT